MTKLNFSKVEIKEDNVLYFEFTPEYDPIKITLKIDGKKFTGKGVTYNGEAEIKGEKTE